MNWKSIGLWAAGIGGSIWALNKFVFKKQVNPYGPGGPLEGRPNKSGPATPNPDEKTNFTGKLKGFGSHRGDPRFDGTNSQEGFDLFAGSPRPIIKNNQFVCPKGYKWSAAERKCVPGGFGAEFAGGKTTTQRFDPGFDGENLNSGSNNLEGFDLMSGMGFAASSFGRNTASNSGGNPVFARTVKSQNGKPIKWKDKSGNTWVERSGNMNPWGPEGPVMAGKVKKSQNGAVISWTDSKGNTWVKA